MDDNPFERYGIDPREGVVAITERLKELAEDAATDAERNAIRAAWEELTLHPARRFRAALFAHPDTRAPLGDPPSLPRARAVPVALGLRDLAAWPSAVAALPPSLAAVALREASADGFDALSLDDDPQLQS